MDEDYTITFVSREEIIDEYLDMINEGIELTEEQLQLIKDLSK